MDDLQSCQFWLHLGNCYVLQKLDGKIVEVSERSIIEKHKDLQQGKKYHQRNKYVEPLAPNVICPFYGVILDILSEFIKLISHGQHIGDKECHLSFISFVDRSVGVIAGE